MLDSHALDLYWYWIKERHNIYMRRAAGQPWPWTEDPIFQTYKFTNAYRELDAGTVWLRENWRGPYANDPELFANIMMYRRYNWIGTAEALGYTKDYDHEQTVVDLMCKSADGTKIFTGAHMLCGNIRDPETGVMPPGKIEQIFGISFRLLWAQRRDLEPKPGDTLESAFNRLRAGRIPGYGDFINYEVISDLRWTRYLRKAKDIMSWANPGPGAKRGILRIYGLPINEKGAFSRASYIDVMRWLRKKSEKELPLYPPMEMRDIEHSLCEYDKYCRVLYNQGEPRQKFIPPHLRPQQV